MPFFPEYARARRVAYIVASVPELAKRTWSIAKRLQIRSPASREIGDGVTKSIPSFRDASISATTTGFRWPASIAPKPMERSSN